MVISTLLRRICFKARHFVSKYSTKYPCKQSNPFDCIKITVLGNWYPTGRIAAMMLKQCHSINQLRLYGLTDTVCQTAVDLSSFDTHTIVTAYKGGSRLLQEAIKDVDIILIIGGDPDKLSLTNKKLFLQNVDAIKYFTIHIAEYNPNAIVILATPPINTFLPLMCEEFKKAGVFDPRKLLGLCNTMSIRANALIGEFNCTDPTPILCPIVGGCSGNTVVPVFSQATPKFILTDEEADQLQLKLTTSETKILEKKIVQNLGAAYLSPAYAATRFINTLINGMKGDSDAIECAYIYQTGHMADFLPYLSCIIRLGPNGIIDSYMPKLNDRECRELQKAYPILKDHIDAGTSFVTGDLTKKPRLKIMPSNYCQTLHREPVEVVGDVLVDLSKKYKNFKIITS